MTKLKFAGLIMASALPLMQPNPGWAGGSPQVSTASLPDPIDRAVGDLALSKFPDGDNGLEGYTTFHLVKTNGEKIDVVDQGTMHEQDVQVTDHTGKVIELSNLESAEENKFNLGTRLLPYAGRVYVLSYVDNAPVYLDQVDRMTPDHKLVSVCRVSPHTDVLFLNKDDGDKPLCNRVAAGKVSYVAEHKLAQPMGVESKELAGDAGVEANVAVDFRNDGKLRLLQRVGDYSGAGSGCDHSEFRSPGNGATSDAKSVLEALQDKSSSNGWVPGTKVHGCSDEPEVWFRDHGRSYLEMRSKNYRHPVSADSEYWLVSTIEHGKAPRLRS